MSESAVSANEYKPSLTVLTICPSQIYLTQGRQRMKTVVYLCWTVVATWGNAALCSASDRRALDGLAEVRNAWGRPVWLR